MAKRCRRLIGDHSMRQTGRPPLHERWQAWGRLRADLRRRFYDFVDRTFSTDDGRRIACNAASSLGVRHPRALLWGAPMATPYPELGMSPPAPRPSDRSDV